ncbi:hypothetical protein QUF70_02080 [Desulfobacterales bacterium HSG17]|nr:hypothetical protein [Desulfobacterales bacterium HSG17]
MITAALNQYAAGLEKMLPDLKEFNWYYPGILSNLDKNIPPKFPEDLNEYKDQVNNKRNWAIGTSYRDYHYRSKPGIKEALTRIEIIFSALK